MATGQADFPQESRRLTGLPRLEARKGGHQRQALSLVLHLWLEERQVDFLQGSRQLTGLPGWRRGREAIHGRH